MIPHGQATDTREKMRSNVAYEYHMGEITFKAKMYGVLVWILVMSWHIGGTALLV